jgi:Domain of unknown function (DUF4276)
MRLLIHVEGQTEETFVNEVLRAHLVQHGYTSVEARLIGNARLRVKRGGIKSWSSVRGDIVRHLREDTTARSTLMVDYYAMPSTGERAWPGRLVSENLATLPKAQSVENALLTDITSAFGANFNPKRFLPFVLMHEFEGLLFSDCDALAKGIGQGPLAPLFHKIRNDFETPEDINDSPETAPSKRIENLVPGYEKPLYGALAILEIGLEKLREECPHFDGWLSTLESFTQP